MYYSKLKQQASLHNRRSFILLLGKISLFSLIGWKLFNITTPVEGVSVPQLSIVVTLMLSTIL